MATATAGPPTIVGSPVAAPPQVEGGEWPLHQVAVREFCAMGAAGVFDLNIEIDGRAVARLAVDSLLPRPVEAPDAANPRA